jgi:hypothetical protein
MDPKTGQVHTFKPGQTDEADGKKKITHHSTPLAGAPVAGAGHLVMSRGNVKEIHDDSGHYKPSADFTLQVVEQLEKLGASLLDDSVVDAQGRPPGAEHRAKYEELKKRLKRVQDVYDEARVKLGDKFDASKPPAELVNARTAIEKGLQELRALGFAPGNRPAVVKLQGKVAIDEKDFDPLKGNLDAINAYIEKKSGRKNVLPATIDPRILKSLEALNLEIGKALAVTLTTQQFKQTGGNEQAIQKKAEAMDLIRKRGQTAEHQPQGKAADTIERKHQEIEQREKAAQPKTAKQRLVELGGTQALVTRGFPAKQLPYIAGSEELAVQVLEGSMTMEDFRDRVGA